MAKLVPGDGSNGDMFGHRVALSGDTVILGAYADDDFGDRTGAAYVFRDTGPGWTQVAKLLPDRGDPYDFFGLSVAISGNLAIVGATMSDNLGANSGSAYVYRLVPEPGSLAAWLILGMVGIVGLRHRRLKTAEG